MTVAYEAIVENGQIRLPAAVKLPDRTKVFVVVPDAPVAGEFRIITPRLVHPEQAADFVKEVIADDNHAHL